MNSQPLTYDVELHGPAEHVGGGDATLVQAAVPRFGHLDHQVPVGELGRQLAVLHRHARVLHPRHRADRSDVVVVHPAPNNLQGGNVYINMYI